MSDDDDECEWDDCPPLPPKLQHYGKHLNKRLMDSRSSLYQEQRDALEAVVNWFSNEETQNLTAVVVMPTGTGKSGVICCLPYSIGAAIEEKRIASDQIQLSKPILIIAPSLVIMKQLEENFSPNGFLKKRGILTQRDIERDALYTSGTLINSEEVKQLSSRDNLPEIILSNSQKWRKKKDDTLIYEDLPKDLFSMVIIDEAHHLPASQWEEIVKQFRPHAKIVFFTATPYRADEREITTDRAIHTKGFAYKLLRNDVIEKKLIREINPVIIEKDPCPSAAERMKVAFDIQDDGEKSTAERMKYAMEVLIEVKKRLKEKNKTQPLPCNIKHASIVIAKNIAEANMVKELCTRELGFVEHRVIVAHGKTLKNRKMKEKALKEIQAGNVEIVVIVKMLLEGFDYPPLSIAGIVTSIQSPVKFAQFIGRVQRIVRVKNEVETGVKADIITHKYFKQNHLLQDYLDPCINEDEDLLLDEIGLLNQDLDDWLLALREELNE